MPEEVYDSFAPGTGMKENWDGTIRSVTFEKQENGDRFSAHIIWAADDGDEVEQFLGIGNDWHSYDGGASVEHPKGEHQKFHGSTNWSEWLVFATFGFDGDPEDPRARACPPPKEGEAGNGALLLFREADRASGGRAAQFGKTFEGLRFHNDIIKRPGRSFTPEKDAEGNVIKLENGRDKGTWTDIEGGVDRMMPLKFLGTAGAALPKQEPASSSTTPPASDQSSAETTSDAPSSATQHPALARLSLPDRVKIIGLAKGKDFGTFIDETIKLNVSLTDGSVVSIMDVAEIMQGLGDEEMYQTLRK